MTQPATCACGAPRPCYPLSDPTGCSFSANGYLWCDTCATHHRDGTCRRVPVEEPA